MNILTVENITKSYGERKLFDNASFYLQEGEKVGVIGINGTGKSTLLKIMAGLEEPDEGSVTKANHVVVRFLSQQPEFRPEDTILESVLRGNKKSGGQTAGGAQEEDWEMESQAKTMLTRLGVTDFSQKCGELSGGQKKRLALVAALLTPADILILDEPTNHLDNNMADWLEDFLLKWKGAVVMVTHDRYFLDSVATRIIEIDKGSIYSYQSNYEGYLSLKAEREEMQAASERKRQSILRNELAWMQRGARARSTKQKARIQRYEELKGMDGPAADGRVDMGSVSSRMGRTTLELSHISKAYGTKKLIEDFSYIFLKNERVGFIGPNGCGKTSLIKTILNLYEKDSGAVFVTGHSMENEEIAAKDQLGVVLDECLFDADTRVETNARCFGALYSRYDHRLFLEFCRRFDVDPKKKIGKLSKGQKARFQLAFAFSHDAKVFLMDEPAAGLDPLFRKELMGYMQEIVEDGTRSILFSTHITEDLDQIGDYILLMDYGRLILDLTREELADRYLLLHGTKEQLEQLDSQMVVCQNFGEYRNSTLIDSAKAESLHLGALTVTRPSLEDLMYCFHKGGVIQ